jgi:hypothetical protein
MLWEASVQTSIMPHGFSLLLGLLRVKKALGPANLSKTAVVAENFLMPI